MRPEARLAVSVLLATGGSAHIVAQGELDIATAPSLADALARAGRRGRRVVLDLRAVSFLDPAALARVCGATRAMRGRLSVVPPAGGPARRLLEVSRLDDLLPT